MELIRNVLKIASSIGLFVLGLVLVFALVMAFVFVSKFVYENKWWIFLTILIFSSLVAFLPSKSKKEEFTESSKEQSSLKLFIVYLIVFLIPFVILAGSGYCFETPGNCGSSSGGGHFDQRGYSD